MCVRVQAKPALVLSKPLKPIRPPDIQALLLWCLADLKEGKTPAWAFVQVWCLSQ